MSGYTYLASPYTHADEAVRFERFHKACKAAAKLMIAGETIFSPIAHSHPIDFCIGEPQSHDFWMKQDIPLLRHADCLKVLCLTGWEQSRGVRQEIELALSLNLPVEYIHAD